MSSTLFRTKTVEQSIRDTEEPEHALKKSLSALDLTVFGVGVIIGTGIFVLTGTVAKKNAGPGRRPGLRRRRASSARSPRSATPSSPPPSRWPGRRTPSPTPPSANCPPGSSAGTWSWSSRSARRWWPSAGPATSRSLLDNAGWHLPEALGGRDGADGFGFDILAAALVLVLTAILVLGMKLSARVTTVVVAIKVTVVLIVIIAGAFFIKGDNYDPFIPKAQAVEAGSGLKSPLIQLMFGWAPSNFGVMGIFTAASVVFFAFIGFDVVATAAEETKNPQRDMPRGILGSLIICTTLYVAVSIVVTGMQNYTELSVERPARRRLQGRRAPLVRGRHQLRRRRRPHHGLHDPAARPDPGVLRDEPRRTAAALLLPRPPAVQDPVPADHPARRDHRDRRRLHQPRASSPSW